MIFSLVFNGAANTFLWVLDPEQTMPVELVDLTPQTKLHILSGFAFFQRDADSRKILIGVDQHNVIRNNYFDGPFDQLPDNWLPETDFKALVERSIPSLQGQINARGEYNEMEARVAVMPYMHYTSLADLLDRQSACLSSTPMGQNALFLACMVMPGS